MDVDQINVTHDPPSDRGPHGPLVLAACVAILLLLALLIFGITSIFHSKYREISLGVPAAVLALIGFAVIFRWAWRQKKRFGIEEDPHGNITPRWYIRVPVLFAFGWLVIGVATSGAGWWASALLLTPFALAFAWIYRPDRLRPVKRPFTLREPRPR